MFNTIAWAVRSVMPSAITPGVGRKGLLVLFLSSAGPVDAVYRERIDAIAAKCATSQVDVLGLFSGKTETASSIAMMRLPFPCAVDEGNAFADAYRATCTPEVFLLDEERHVVYTGAIDSSTWGGEAAVSYLSLAINALVLAKLPNVQQTMPFGTFIAR
jgi:hypothetical protein